AKHKPRKPGLCRGRASGTTHDPRQSDPSAACALNYRLMLQRGHVIPSGMRLNPYPKIVLLGVALACSRHSSKAAESDNTPPAGFTALFNGKDLTGWKGLLAPPYDNP